MKRLHDRIAVITGGGQGIGKALALGLAREGAKVVIAEINEHNALAVRREIQAEGGTAIIVKTDVSNEDSVEAMAETALRELGKLDILINNAGIFPSSSIEEMSEEEWDRVIGTNLVGTFLCSRAVTRRFGEGRKGRIISITSGRALQGAKNGGTMHRQRPGL